MLRHLSSEALAELAARARRRSLAATEVVFKEGDPGDALHIVTAGALAVVRPSHDSDLVLERLGPGQAFGELAVLNGAARLASVIAIESSETVEVGRDDF